MPDGYSAASPSPMPETETTAPMYEVWPSVAKAIEAVRLRANSHAMSRSGARHDPAGMATSRSFSRYGFASALVGGSEWRT